MKDIERPAELQKSPSGARSGNGAQDVRELLLQITRAMAMAEDLEGLLQTIVDAALGIVPAATKCVIHLLDASGTRLQARFCSDPSPAMLQGSGMPANVGIAGRALREKRLVCVEDASKDPDFVPLRSGTDLRSLLVVPLIVQDVPLGTLSLSSDRPAAFGAEDCQHADILGAQASVAIRQLHLLLEANTQRARSDAIIESMSDGLLILDAQGHIVRANATLYRMLGLPLEEREAQHNLQNALLDDLLDPQATFMGPWETERILPHMR